MTQKLLRGCKVINTAVKYGYDSPDSFSRIFHRFHGVLPSRVCQQGVTLASFAPMKINLGEGGTMLKYKIIEKPALTVAGYKKLFNNEPSYQGIPEQWEEIL